MQIEVSSCPFKDQTTPLLVIPVFEDEPGSAFVELNRLLDEKATGWLGKEGGKANHLTPVTPWKGVKAERVLLVGLGKKHEFTLEKLRRAAGKAASQAQGLKTSEMAFVLPAQLDQGDESACATLGTILGSYRYERFLTEKKPGLEKLILLGGCETGANRGRILAEETALARDLANEPANSLTPEAFAELARKTAEELKLECTVLEKGQMEALGMGGILGVSAGSSQAPKFIVLEYHGSDEAPIVFVGKGITFDSGGLCLKPRDSMEEMKDDMSGAAAVLGAIRAIARLGLPRHIVMLIPACENMPSGSAFRPSDILSISGKSVEVGNTDAEGRLILADALAYAKRYKPQATIDLATLTGACVVALGTHATGMLGNDEDLKNKIKKAGEETNERVWELPLWEEFAEQLKSDVADFKNTGGRNGGAITASAFLSKFVEGPWVHLDIAGTSRDDKGSPYIPKGVTGVGVRLLTRLALNW